MKRTNEYTTATESDWIQEVIEKSLAIENQIERLLNEQVATNIDDRNIGRSRWFDL